LWTVGAIAGALRFQRERAKKGREQKNKPGERELFSDRDGSVEQIKHEDKFGG
jgi:hypothetical protein